MALQLVHEAALCTTGIRRRHSLSQKGFELANGLPFVATDQAIHQMLERHTVAEAQALRTGRVERWRGSDSALLYPFPSAVGESTCASTAFRRHSVWESEVTVMSMTVEQIAFEALGLPTKKRAELARKLISSLDEDWDDPEEVEAAWKKEIERRIKEVDKGRAKCIPAEEVFRKLRRELRRKPTKRKRRS